MEHSIRILFRESDETYGGYEWRLPQHGSIQDNGVSPLIWAAISNVLFLAVKEKIRGHFLAPITKLVTALAWLAFVDDTDLLQIQDHSTYIIEKE